MADNGLPKDKVYITETRKGYSDGDLQLIIPKLNVDVPVLNGVDAQTLLRGVGRIVERGGVGAPVVAQRFVEFGVFVGDVVADAFPVDRLLLLPPAHFAFEPLLLGGELFELLQIDVEALRGGPASDDDLRTDESDGQQQVGDQRNAQSRTVIERPFARILPAVVEGKTQFGPSGLRFGFLRGHRAEDFAQK